LFEPKRKTNLEAPTTRTKNRLIKLKVKERILRKNFRPMGK